MDRKNGIVKEMDKQQAKAMGTKVSTRTSEWSEKARERQRRSAAAQLPNFGE